MKTISLLHPFSAQAIGLKETDLYCNHSKPHENALKYLSKLGYSTSISYFTGGFLPFTKNVEGVKKMFFPVTTPLFANRHKWRKQDSLFHYLSTVICPPDLTIINMSGHGSNYVFKLGELLKKKGKAYVAMIGGLNVSANPLAIQYYQQAQCVVVHTEVQKRNLEALSEFKNLDIRVVPLGVDTSLFKPSESKPKDLRLLYVGRISRLKQIEKAIEAIVYIKSEQRVDCHLTIIGFISDTGYYQELKKMVELNALHDCVTFMGPLNQKDLIPYYQNASLLLLPSKHESFGMVMIEAMACGTPVVALKNTGGPDEIIESGVNGYLCSPEDYSVEVFDVLTSRTLHKMAMNARFSVLNKWSLDYTKDCFKSLIESVFLRDS
ncbi:glycosyltransferase family 4 protein [Aestuariivivens sediminis]|uniref:glycosyltransferase family 4 protein n=1 Tax=Aestuariivivens sediminis TaxID=2913557 RepID=UPI001F5671E7|nr:glycosyltransferase family 4 protein [Aestuariivivens sediminis]